MTQDASNLVWIDMEMSGLEPDRDVILEVAILVTDKDLNIIAQAPVLVVHQSDAVLAAMDDWNQRTHGQSGLIERVRQSSFDEKAVETAMLDFLEQHVLPRSSPMCGNTICQDRRFLARHMPALEAYFHYRNLDVSTLKELARRWRPDVLAGFQKSERHEALADILESIDELKHYRTHFLRME